jgi:hypothetical protein
LDDDSAERQFHQEMANAKTPEARKQLLLERQINRQLDAKEREAILSELFSNP